MSCSFLVKFVLQIKMVTNWNWSCLWESVAEMSEGGKKCNCPRWSLRSLVWKAIPFCKCNLWFENRGMVFKRQKSNLCAKPAEVVPLFLVQDDEEVEIWNLQCQQDGKPISHPAPACFLVNLSALNLGISNCWCLSVQHPNLGKLLYKLTFSRWQCRAPQCLLPNKVKIIYISN